MTTVRDDLAGLDAPVRTLFERIAGPAAGSPPDLASIGAALSSSRATTTTSVDG